MITEKNILRSLAGGLAIALLLIWIMGNDGLSEPAGLPRETDLDLPGDFERYYDYGERVNAWRERYGMNAQGERWKDDSVGKRYVRYGVNAQGERYELRRPDYRRGHEGRLAKFVKLDIDADMNYDGTIDNYDPADQGLYETTPPGLIVGAEEMAKLVIRFRMNHIGFQEWEETRVRVDPRVRADSDKLSESEKWEEIQGGVGKQGEVGFRGHAVVTMEVVGINRSVQSGLFKDFKHEKEEAGRIRVWRDEKKKKLLLDSGIASKRVYEWSAENRFFPENLPGGVPRTVYVEGVSKSGQYIGDIRLLVTVSWRDRSDKRRMNNGHPDKETVGSVNKRADAPIEIGNRSYRAAYDHILFTVKEEPQQKEFINNNLERIWLNPDGTPQGVHDE